MLEQKETRKKLKALKKGIKELKKQYKKLEFRPCQNDADLLAKEEALKGLMEKIYSLESEQDKVILGNVRKYLT